MFCNHCGEQNSENAKYCSGCGKEMNLQETSAEKHQELNTSTKQEDSGSLAKKPKSKKTVLSWLFGILSLFAAIGTFGTENAVVFDYLVGVCLVAISVLLIPPLRKYVNLVLKREVSTLLRGAIVTLLVFFAFVLVGLAEQQRERVAQEQLVAIQQKKIEVFEKNPKQILNQIERLIESGNYVDALKKINVYSNTNSTELLALDKKAREGLQAITAANEIRAEQKRIAIKEKEERLTEEVKQEKIAKQKESEKREVLRKKLIEGGLVGFWSCDTGSLRFFPDGTFSDSPSGYTHIKLPAKEQDNYVLTKGGYVVEGEFIRMNSTTNTIFWNKKSAAAMGLKSRWDTREANPGTYNLYHFTPITEKTIEVYTHERSGPPGEKPHTPTNPELRTCERKGNEKYEDASYAGVEFATEKELNANDPENEIVSLDYTNALRPLVEPDMKLYRWMGVLERMDKQGKSTTYVVALGDPQFKFGVVAGDLAEVDVSGLRIGGQIVITGRYISNFDYVTVLGVPKTAPLLAALKISTH